MSAFFLTIVNMSISASWIVLAVLLLRALLKKAPKWITVLLWGIVAVRLICPFSIESVMSLIPSAETISPEIMMDASPTINTGIPVINDVVNPVISGSFAPEPMASANPLQILIPVAANVWALGAVGMLLYTAVSYGVLRRKVCTAVLLRDNVYQCETVGSPFVLGVIKPRIYIPFGMAEQDTAHVIAHENAHIRRKDHLWKPVGFLLLAVHWFNPLVWLGYVLLCRDIELACDEKVIKVLDAEQKADYSEALLKCSVNRKTIAACPLAFGEMGVKNRVKSVLNYKKPAFWIIIVAIIASVVAAVCFLTDPIDSNNTEMLMDVLNNKKTFISESGETFYFVEYKPYGSLEVIPDKYALVDLDGDSNDELVVYITPEVGEYMVFHVYNNKVYGFVFGGRSLMSLKEDGSFVQSGGAGLNVYACLKFEKNKYSIIELAYVDDYAQLFRINGVATTAEKAEAYVDGFYNKSDVVWTKYENASNTPEPNDTSVDETTTFYNYRDIYEQFLAGKASAFDKNGIAKPLRDHLLVNYLDWENYKYAYWDMTGDGIPELCIDTLMELCFFTIENGKLYHWYTDMSAYSKLLNNGAFLYERHGGAPTRINYEYYVLDANANETFRVTFSWWDGKTIEQGKEYPDVYIFNDEEVTKEEYEARTKQYLEAGNDRLVWYDKNGNIAG